MEYRVKTFGKDVVFSRETKTYSMLSYPKYDHVRFLYLDGVEIGFVFSNYTMIVSYEDYAMEGHSVVEVQQLWHANATTIAVIKNEHLSCLTWALQKYLSFYDVHS